MKNIIKIPFKVVAAVFKALGPVFSIILIIIVFATALFIYDGLKTLQNQKLSISLSQNLNTDASCVSKLIGQKDNFEFKFIFKNENSQIMQLNRMGIYLNILGSIGNKFTKFLETKPPSTYVKDEGQFSIYEFESAVEIPAKGTKEVLLKMQTATRKEATAAPNTIIIYSGDIIFELFPKITTKATCEVNVRYSQ